MWHLEYSIQLTAMIASMGATKAQIAPWCTDIQQL